MHRIALDQTADADHCVEATARRGTQGSDRYLERAWYPDDHDVLVAYGCFRKCASGAFEQSFRDLLIETRRNDRESIPGCGVRSLQFHGAIA
jgi:hypothetical protein